MTLTRLGEFAFGPLRLETSAAADPANGAAWRRYAALVGVAAIHIAVFWVFAAAMRSVPPIATQELQITLFNPHITPAQPPAPPLGWTFQMPEEALVPDPEIKIAPEQGSPGGTTAGVMMRRLAPTLDPSHVNERPELPGTLGSLIAALSLRLRILVMPDGSVLAAEVAQSTGEAEIDHLAIEWVKADWRYQPASVNGRPIEAWMTVVVRFAAIH